MMVKLKSREGLKNDFEATLSFGLPKNVIYKHIQNSLFSPPHLNSSENSNLKIVEGGKIISCLFLS